MKRYHESEESITLNPDSKSTNQYSDLTIKASVDTVELDKAIEKAEKLVELLEKADELNKRQSSIAPL